MVTGDRIVFVGTVDLARVAPRRVLEATGRVVTPGFIDAHAHGDPRRTPGFSNFLAMGVTTICLGQDGSSPAGAGDFAAWTRLLDRGRFAPNICAFVGHGTVRKRSGAGLSKTPSAAQLDAMARLVDDAMRAGAFGMSTGLEYEPGRFAGAAELAQLARPVAAHGGLIMSHIRSEDDDAIDASLEELLTQCATAGCAAHVAHLKVVYGHGAATAARVLGVLAAAQAQKKLPISCGSSGTRSVSRCFARGER